jgi:hypothetical protein
MEKIAQSLPYPIFGQNFLCGKNIHNIWATAVTFLKTAQSKQ